MYGSVPSKIYKNIFCMSHLPCKIENVEKNPNTFPPTPFYKANNMRKIGIQIFYMTEGVMYNGKN